MKEVPIFIVNGFLESGKTSLIKEIVENNDTYHNGTTVIITTEEGEVEYDDEWCKKYGITLKTCTEKEKFTQDYIEAIDKECVADRYVIEYNSFFDLTEQDFPDYMAIYQIITLIDASTFKVMFNNMRNVFSNMLKFSSLVIFNRCDGVNDLANFRRQIRAINQQAQIAFENSDGQLTTMLEEDLPYDLKKDVIPFEEDASVFIHGITQEITDLEGQIRQLTQDMREAQERIRELMRQNEERRSILKEIYESKTWKAHLKLVGLMGKSTELRGL